MSLDASFDAQTDHRKRKKRQEDEVLNDLPMRRT